MIATAARSAPPRTLTLGIALLAVATIFFGFGFSIVPEVVLRLRPAVLYLHVLTAVSWVGLFAVQAVLVRRRDLALHRRLGHWGLWLGGVVSVTAFATALLLRREGVLAHPDGSVGRIAFLAVPLTAFLIYTLALGAAAFWRNRAAYHRRAIMLAGVLLMSPALARVPGVLDVPVLTAIIPDLLILLLCVQEYRTERRVHLVYLVGLPIALALQLNAFYLFLGRPAWWVGTARALIGV